MTNLVENSTDLKVYQNEDTFVRFFTENNGRTYEIAGEGLKFSFFDAAEEYAAK